MALELMFSWGSYSGYNQSPGAFPYWVFMTYHIIPPSLWLFISCSYHAAFRLKPWHALLFLPALAEVLIHSLFKTGINPFSANLLDYRAWVWFTDYIPLAGFILLMGYFWYRFIQAYQGKEFKPDPGSQRPHSKLLIIMCSLSLLSLLWLTFSFIGWDYFAVIELLLVLLFFVFSFLIFFDIRSLSLVHHPGNREQFSNYDDQIQLHRLTNILEEKQLFTQPGLSLKELSRELNLPPRYLSYLINRYHQKNFSEFINEHRIDAFITKARSPEGKQKTLLAIALESGFNSKSSFNQVFRDLKGKPPSEYLHPD